MTQQLNYKIMNAKNNKNQIKHLENKRDFYLNAFNSCHNSMKNYYYNKVKTYNLLIADLK